jgi:hypothetical protein
MAGLDGARGADGGGGGTVVVDANGQEVGALLDAMNGYVIRKVNGDPVFFAARSDGLLPPAELFFLHNTSNCSGDRYLQITGDHSLAYLASVRGNQFFYTKATDAIGIVVQAYEHFEADQDAMQRGTCTPWEGGEWTVGVATSAVDQTLTPLALPLRVK